MKGEILKIIPKLILGWEAVKQMGHAMRKPVYDIRVQERRRSV